MPRTVTMGKMKIIYMYRCRREANMSLAIQIVFVIVQWVSQLTRGRGHDKVWARKSCAARGKRAGATRRAALSLQPPKYFGIQEKLFILWRHRGNCRTLLTSCFHNNTVSHYTHRTSKLTCYIDLATFSNLNLCICLAVPHPRRCSNSDIGLITCLKRQDIFT